MPRDALDPIGRLRVLGIALDAAATADHWSEVHELLFQRDEAIRELRDVDLSTDDRGRLAEVVEIDERTIRAIEGRKRDLCLEIRARIGGTSARQAYRSNAAHLSQPPRAGSAL